MNQLTLYQLADEYRQLMELAADPEADADSFNAALNALEGDFKSKGIAVAQVARNLEALHDQIMAAIKSMALRADAAKRRAESTRAYLRDQMTVTGITKIESPLLRLALRKSPPRVVVASDALVPPDYQRHIPERWEPDKTKISAALKAGETIDGCRLEQSTWLEIK